MIHKFEVNGIKMVLDVNSGAVHEIDNLVWDILEYGKELNIHHISEDLGKKYDKVEIIEAVNELKELIDQGLLYSDWEEGIPHQTGEPVIKAMCLHAAHDCNLRCSYCFASTGDFKGGRVLLDIETGKKALEFLIKHSGHRRNLEVDFFGGEPLMNFDVVMKIVQYGRELEVNHNKKFNFTITTNGVLLDDTKLQSINKEFVNVVVSLDGRPEIHNRMRKTINNQGSYGHVLSNAQRLADSRHQDNYYVRGTFTRYNLDFDKDVIHLADCGFKQISIEPVVSTEEADYELTEADLPEIFRTYEDLAAAYLQRRKEGKAFNFFHFIVDLTQGPCAAKRTVGCGAGNEYIAVTPEGDIYPCHQFVGDEEFKMGNVHYDHFNIKIQNQFRESNVFTKDECSKCWAKFYCSGGCSANAYHFNHSIKKPYFLGCEMEKKRLECALMINAVERFHMENETH